MTTYLGLAVIFVISYVRNIEHFKSGNWGGGLGATIGAVLFSWLIIAVVRLIAKKLSDDNPRVMFWTTLPIVLLLVFASLGQWANEHNKRVSLDAEKYLCDPKKGADIIATCTRLIKLDRFSGRDIALLLNNRGLVYLNSGQTNLAIADFERSIYINPEVAPAHYNRGLANAELGQWDNAIRDFTRAVELNPKMAVAWVSRCVANATINRFDSALEDCTRALDLDPTVATAWANRGWAKIKLQQWEGAIRDLTEAVEREPNLAMAWANRCLANIENNQFYSGRDDCTRALDIDPSNAMAWVNRGIVKLALGDPQGLQEIQEAVRLEPQNASYVQALKEAQEAAKKK